MYDKWVGVEFTYLFIHYNPTYFMMATMDHMQNFRIDPYIYIFKYTYMYMHIQI